MTPVTEFAGRDVAGLVGSRYRLLERVGAGASAQVYRAIDLARSGDVALKITRLSADDEGPTQEEVAREYLLASRLAHPNLVRYYSLDIHPDVPCAVVAMEFVDGEPLGGAGQVNDVPTVARHVVGLLRGLQLLHDFGYVHGDVKPANALCRATDEGVITKLLDYHLTCHAAERRRKRVGGTLRYLAPELLRGSLPDERSDLYSLGVLFCEALTGKPLYEGSARELVAQHLGAPASALDAIAAAHGGGLAEVLARLLAKRPEGRFTSAAETIAAISKALGLGMPAETEATLLGRLASVPLVGRDAALDEAKRFLSAVDESHAPRVLVVAGHTGAGRTAFLRQVAALAQSMGFHCVWPAAKGAGSQAAPGMHVALFVDDTDRLAQNDVAAVDGAFRRAGPKGMLCAAIGAARTTSEFDVWQSRHHDMVRIELDELCAEDRRTLLRTALPRDVDAAFIDGLANACSGAPAALSEVLRYLIRAGEVNVDAGGRTCVPADVANTVPPLWLDIAKRLSHDAPPPLGDMLALLASDESGLEPDLLADILGHPSETLAAIVDADPAAAGLISLASAGEHPRWRFHHVAVTRFIGKAMGKERLRAYHDRIADGLLRVPAPDNEQQARTVRHQFLGATPQRGVAPLASLLEGERFRRLATAWPQLVHLAAPYADVGIKTRLFESAADVSMAQGSYAVAADLYQKALAIGQDKHARRASLLERMAEAYISSGQIDDVEDALVRLAALRTEIGETNETPGECLVRALLSQARFDLDSALAYCEQAKARAAMAGQDEYVAAAEWRRGDLLRARSAWRSAARTLATAVCRYRRLDETDNAMRALVSLGHVAMALGNLRRARDFLDRALPRLVERGYDVDAARGLSNLAAVYHRECAWAQAIERYQQALVILDRRGHPEGRLLVLLNLASACTSSGRFEASLSYAERVRALDDDTPRYRGFQLLRAGQAWCSLGDTDRAMDLAQKALEIGDARRLDTISEAAERLVGAAALVQGDGAAAAEYYGRALRRAETGNDTNRQIICHARLAEAALLNCDLDAAAQSAERAMTAATVHKAPVPAALACLAYGKVALARDELDVAITNLRRAEASYGHARKADDLPDMCLALAEAYVRAGQLRIADYYLRTALDMVEEVAAQIASERLRMIYLRDPRRQALFAAIDMLSRRDGEEQ